MVNQFSFNLDQNYLSHHGIKGQKWGVRRYQNYDGSLTNLGRSRRTIGYVNDIVNTMSKRDKKMLGVNGKEYLTTEEQKQIVKRIVKKVNNVPVAFIDFSEDENGIGIAIGTRSGKEYRNKGYATEIAKEGKKWLDKNSSSFDQAVWWVKKDNIASRSIAKTIGFKLNESSVLQDNPWIECKYVK